MKGIDYLRSLDNSFSELVMALNIKSIEDSSSA